MTSPLVDLVPVQLTEAGALFANGLPLKIHGGHADLTFKPGEQQLVHRAVWAEMLKPTAPFGKPLFEIVPPGPTPGADAKPAAAVIEAATETPSAK